MVIWPIIRTFYKKNFILAVAQIKKNVFVITFNHCIVFQITYFTCLHFLAFRIDTINDPFCGHKTVGHNGQYLKNGHNCGYDIFWCGHKCGPKMQISYTNDLKNEATVKKLWPKQKIYPNIGHFLCILGPFFNWLGLWLCNS